MKEKPSSPDSNLAITGLYFYSSRVFEVIDRSIKENELLDRGELEITDINRSFMQMGLAKGIEIDTHWADCGTIDALLETSKLMKEWGLGNWLVTVE